MKLLVICQHYWPEPYPLPDICEALAERGHTVHVVTGVPNYPMGVIYPGYKNRQGRKQTHNGVKITRTFTIGRRHNVLFRFLNYYSYSISSTRYARRLGEDYDAVLAYQSSPVMMARAAMAYGKKHGKKTVLYCLDLWPASLAAGGVGENSWIYRLFGWVSRRIYQKADRLLVTSPMFRGYFRENLGIPAEQIGYLPQYAPDAFGEVPSGGQKQTVDLMFAGNIGAAQSISTILEAAELLREEKCLRWHIVGDGSDLVRVQETVRDRKLDNVILYGRRPKEEMPAFYGMADAMLVTLTGDPYISMTLPGKVQTYLAAGKPVLGAADGEVPRVIEEAGCGFCARAEDSRGLADAVRAFLNAENKPELGENARAYYEAHFTKEKFLNRLEAELQACC